MLGDWGVGWDLSRSPGAHGFGVKCGGVEALLRGFIRSHQLLHYTGRKFHCCLSSHSVLLLLTASTDPMASAEWLTKEGIERKGGTGAFCFLFRDQTVGYVRGVKGEAFKCPRTLKTAGSLSKIRSYPHRKVSEIYVEEIINTMQYIYRYMDWLCMYICDFWNIK